MPKIMDDIAAFETMRGNLETEHLGQWALLYDKRLIGTYGSFEAAAQEAVRRFGRGPYLIRQIGASAMTLPAAVLYHPGHGDDTVRIR